MSRGVLNHNMERKLSHSRLLQLLRYDPQTGKFVWNERPHKRQGAPAGSKHKDVDTEYLRICLDGKRFFAHRLAWFYMTGSWPDHEIDHRDRNGLNNKWNNLRKAKHDNNQANRKCNMNTKTGVKGVTIRPENGRYRARINHKDLGTYSTLKEAKAARERAARATHGEFYREQ